MFLRFIVIRSTCSHRLYKNRIVKESNAWRGLEETEREKKGEVAQFAGKLQLVTGTGREGKFYLPFPNSLPYLSTVLRTAP